MIETMTLIAFLVAILLVAMGPKRSSEKEEEEKDIDSSEK